MPVIKSAIKKQRQDKKREKQNDNFRAALKDSLNKAQKTKTKKEVERATSLVDKAVKKHLMHKNKAARIKSRLSKPGITKKIVVKKTVKKIVKTTSKKAVKKSKKK